MAGGSCVGSSLSRGRTSLSFGCALVSAGTGVLGSACCCCFAASSNDSANAPERSLFLLSSAMQPPSATAMRQAQNSATHLLIIRDIIIASPSKSHRQKCHVHRMQLSRDSFTVPSSTAYTLSADDAVPAAFEAPRPSLFDAQPAESSGNSRQRKTLSLFADALSFTISYLLRSCFYR